MQVFTPDGGYLRQFGKAGNGNINGELNFPASNCVDSDDRAYVGEFGNGRVSVFTWEGVFLKSFGQRRSGPGQFESPFGIAVDLWCGIIMCPIGTTIECKYFPSLFLLFAVIVKYMLIIEIETTYAVAHAVPVY